VRCRRERHTRVQPREGTRARDPVFDEAVRRLEPEHGAFGERPVVPVDRTRRVSGGRQRPLQRAHWAGAAREIAGTGIQDRSCGLERGQHARPDHAVLLKAIGSLKPQNGAFGQWAVQPVDRTGCVSRCGEESLHRAHGRRAVRAGVSGTERQQLWDLIGVGVYETW
jgi:hypothetical protein